MRARLLVDGREPTIRDTKGGRRPSCATVVWDTG